MNFSSFFQRFALLVFVSYVVIAVFIAFTPPPKVESAKNEPKSETLPDYDIRTDENAKQTIADFSVNSLSETDRNLAARAVEKLRKEIPNLKIEYNEDLRIPEVISPDFMRGTNFLTASSGEKRADILREFINRNGELFGVNPAQLEKTADYTNPDDNLSFVQFEQKINSIPVFRGEIKAGFTKKNEIIRVINNLAPSLDYNAIPKNFGSAEQAVSNAARHLNLQANELKQIEATDLKITFERGQFDDNTTAEKMYFPIDYGVARTAWRVLIWTKPAAFYVIVDAETGAMLWRKNITSHQTQTATYNVYGNTTGFAKTGDSPSPFSPGCLTPIGCPQPQIVPRQTFTIIGNEPPYQFNQLGWIPDGENRTIGNAAEAGIDRDGTNGVDPNGWAFGSPNRNFVYNYNPSPGNPAPGEDPVPVPQTYPPSVFQQGSVTNAFYAVNRFHDEVYRFGFTEQARNFQNDNFGLGGLGNDSISVEVQDSSGTNGGNFASPADGGRGRLQCFIWTGSTPDRDAALDSQYIFHELTHGVSSRLHGNGSGLGNQGGMMGEGWSDFYALAMLSEPTDDQLGTHALAGYIMHLLGGMESNYYYGLRRFPYARKSAVGANGLPHNPLTFGYLNAGCDALIGTTTTNPNSAFPRNPIIATSGNCAQVHNGGEIWASTLWEVRGQLIDRHGAAEGNRRALQYTTDGMKLTPINPNMLQERDGIIAATFASDSADVPAVRRGFAIRGMGFSASVQSATAVTEAFDLPDLTASTATVTSGNNLLEPNECNTLNVPIANNSANTATIVSAVLSSNTPGITVTQSNSPYPNISGGGTATNSTPYFVYVNSSVMCYTTANFTLTVTYAGGGGGSPATFNFSLPVGLPGNNYNFTAGTGTIPAGGTLVPLSQDDEFTVNIPLPAGWVSSVYGVNVTSLSASTNGSLSVNSTAATAFTNTALPAAFGPNPILFPLWDDYDMDVEDVTNGGIYTNIVGFAPNRQLFIEWRAQHFSETVNGPISTNFAVVLTEGSSNIRYIYALTGNAPNQNGASATVGVQRQSTGTLFTQHSFNSAVITPGLQLDGVLPGGQCTPGQGSSLCLPPQNVRADFDGDGRSDISVFRPSEGNWYLNRSTAGFGVVKWGVSTDKIMPGDYDGDGKTDFAVFRKGENSSWYILNSSSNTVRSELWGASNIEQAILFDTPIAADYDGDGKTDLAVWRLTDFLTVPARFLIKQSSNNTAISTQWGKSGDVPVLGDFDGDSKTDLAIYRGGTWWILQSSNNSVQITQYGLSQDILAPADYNGDGRDDLAVFRASNGTWYIKDVATVAFGNSTDIPVPADYDGDGKTDIAIYRNGTWWINRSTAGVLALQFGLGNDIPIPSGYLP